MLTDLVVAVGCCFTVVGFNMLGSVLVILLLSIETVSKLPALIVPGRSVLRVRYSKDTTNRGEPQVNKWPSKCHRQGRLKPRTLPHMERHCRLSGGIY